MNRSIALLLLLMGCNPGGETRLDATLDAGVDATVRRDAAPWDAAPDASSAYLPCPVEVDAGVSVQLTLLDRLCQETTEGQYNAMLISAREGAAKCGADFSDQDLEEIDLLLSTMPKSGCANAEMLAQYEESIAAGRMQYDESRIDACQNERRSGRTDPMENDELIASCRVLTGLVPRGGMCFYHEECTTVFCAPAATETCEGICADPLAVGSSCRPMRDICAPDTACLEDAQGAHRCLPRALAGESCGPPNCAAGLTCLDGFCAPFRPEGEPCTSSSICELDLRCVKPSDQSTGFCRPRAGVHEVCGTGRDGNPTCGECLHCDGVCVTRTSSGACASDDECVDHYYCRLGSCQRKPRRGAACLVNSQYPRGNCLYRDDFCALQGAPEGSCTERPKVCELCDSSSDCQEGDCREDTDGTHRCLVRRSAPPPSLLPLGSVCGADRECTSGFCDRVQQVCAVSCPDAGCQGGYLTYYGALLFFGMVITRRRR